MWKSLEKKQEPVDRVPMKDTENHKIAGILETKGILAIFIFMMKLSLTGSCFFRGKALFVKVSFDAEGKTMI